MKYLRKYNEDIDTDISTNKYSDLRSEISELIENSLKTSDNKTLGDFISAFLKNPEETQIEGLINSSDIYDFYTKYGTDVDQVLEEELSKSPSDIESFSLYDYVVKQTKVAIKKVVTLLIEDIENKKEKLLTKMFWKKEEDKLKGKIVLVSNKTNRNLFFVYQILDKELNSVLIGTLNKFNQFDFWLDTKKKVDGKTIDKKFIFEKIDDYLELNEAQRNILREVFTKIETDAQGNLNTLEIKIKKKTGVYPKL
jgi:hypothetical protein